MMQNDTCVFNRGKECAALTYRRCPAACKFAKTESELKAGVDAANERVRSLRYGVQQHLAEKYYGGKPPWD